MLALLAAAILVVVGQAAGGTGGTYQVRAIFDSGNFLVKGEQVRVAGATVGTVSSVDVTMPGERVHENGQPDSGKAVVLLEIDDPAFQDFRRDASCLIRPQSLLGEKYVDCEPTQPRAPGTQPPPPLQQIPEGEPGAGQRFLALERNGKEVDLDLVQNIMREPFSDRFRLILNELGAGLAARGKELEEIIRRADPALRETDRVLAELARQNHQLSRLAANSDTLLAPLARERQHVSGFINNSKTTAEATAERSRDLEASLQRFPGALRELRRVLSKLRSFSDAATPVFADLRAGAPAITRATKALGPFSHAATPALTSLGNAAQQSQRPLVSSDPILRKVRDLSRKAAPGAQSLATLLRSLRKTGGFEKLMSFFYFSVGSVNGFDQYGHFLRAFLQVTACTTLLYAPLISCTANFGSGESATAKAAATPAAATPAAATPATSLPRPSPSLGPGVEPTGVRDAQGDVAAGGTLEPAPSADRAPVQGPPSIGATRDLLDTLIGPQGNSSDPSQGSGP